MSLAARPMQLGAMLLFLAACGGGPATTGDTPQAAATGFPAADRPTAHHGTPPALLECEFAAVGYARVAMRPMPLAGGYLAVFAARGPRPAPAMIRPCKSGVHAKMMRPPADGAPRKG